MRQCWNQATRHQRFLDGLVHRRVDVPFACKAHLGFGRRDIDIHLRWIDLHHYDRRRVARSVQSLDALIRFVEGAGHGFVPHVAGVHKRVLGRAAGFQGGGRTNEAGDLQARSVVVQRD